MISVNYYQKINPQSIFMKKTSSFVALCLISIATFASPLISTAAKKACNAALTVTYVYPDGSVYGSYTYYGSGATCGAAMDAARARQNAVEAAVNDDPSSPIHVY
ncbi:hypothetical protein N824_18110 [Pedobacter sp. V48]|nr:hypothetical protein N824_18110 [Pedobacter sp. V48]